MCRTRPVTLALLILCLCAHAGSAQDTTAVTTVDWLIGGSVGLPGFGIDTEPELFTLAFHSTQFRPGRIGSDFFIGTMPRVLLDGVVPIGVRAGAALPFPAGDGVLLVPSGGVSLLGAVGEGGEGGIAGINFGLATMFLDDEFMGMRAGLTWHRFRGFDSFVWLLEVGFVRPPL